MALPSVNRPLVNSLRNVPRPFIHITLVFLAIMCSCTWAHGQETHILDRFSITESEGSVFLSWTISLGNTCQGTNIQRSTDSINFSEIGRIAGVCGSTEKAESYTFEDVAPVKNHQNYYRLELGLTGFSEVLNVEVIDLGNAGLQIRPNPATDQVTIHFENRQREEFLLEVFDQHGMLIQTASGSQEKFSLETSHWPTGIHFFRLASRESSEIQIGKFLVVHP